MTMTFGGTGSSAFSGAGLAQTGEWWLMLFGDSKTQIPSTVTSWPGPLAVQGAAASGRIWSWADCAVGGRTVATTLAALTAMLAAMPAATGAQDIRALINLGVNDITLGLPAEAAWEADYLAILDAIHAKWPSARIYVTRPWLIGSNPGAGGVLATSSFTGTENPLSEGGVWDSAAAVPWTLLQKATGALGPTANCRSRLAVAAAANQYAEITYDQDPGASSWVGVSTRITGLDGYLAIAYNGAVSLYKCQPSTTFTQLATAAASVGTAPRRLRLTSVGSLHTVSFNGVDLIAFTDATFATGSLGIAGSTFGGPTVVIQTFEGGTTGGVPGPSFETECNTLATRIDHLVAARPAFVVLGDDERVWLKGSDSGITNTTDGTHYSPAGNAAALTAKAAVLWP